MYSARMVERATAVLGERRRKAEEEAARRRQELFALQPRLAELQEEIRGAALSMAVSAMTEDGPRLVEAFTKKTKDLNSQKAAILEEMGLTPQDLEPRYACGLCKDTGVAEGGRCSCFEELIRQESCRSLPQAAQEGRFTFDNFDLSFYSTAPDKNGAVPRKNMTHILEQCKRYARSFGPGSPSLLFLGKTGLGKTHLSLAVSAQVAAQGGSVLYSSVQGLLDRYERLRFNKSPTGQDEEFAAMVPLCDLLILDDLGAEFSTSFSQSVLYNILNDRIMAQRPVILSTNLEPEQLVAAYGDRIASRILCDCAAYTFCGSDIRFKKRERGLQSAGHKEK